MFFQTADIEVALWIPPLTAFVISFFTSMGGVSGAFLLLPFQVSFLGYTNPSVSATNQVFNIVAIPSGVYRYWREGRMVWPLTWVVIAGTLPGVLNLPGFGITAPAIVQRIFTVFPFHPPGYRAFLIAISCKRNAQQKTLSRTPVMVFESDAFFSQPDSPPAKMLVPEPFEKLRRFARIVKKQIA